MATQFEPRAPAGPPADYFAPPAPPQPFLQRTLAAFTYRDFRVLWFGAFTSTVGTWMQKVAQSWLVFDLTKPPPFTPIAEFAVAGKPWDPVFSLDGWLLFAASSLFFLLVLELRDKLSLKVDLEIARQIQFGLLPFAPYVSADLHIQTVMRPANTVGGDYFDLIDLGDDRLAVVEDRVAARLEAPAREAAHGVFVLDEENRLGAPAHRRRGEARRRQGGNWILHPRQIDCERGAAVRLTRDEDMAAALADDAVHGREAQPRAVRFLLRREERLEDSFLGLGVDADSGVGDLDDDVAAGRDAEMFS